MYVSIKSRVFLLIATHKSPPQGIGYLLLEIRNFGDLHYTSYIIMYGHMFSKKSMDQPGKVANPARAQLNREK